MNRTPNFFRNGLARRCGVGFAIGLIWITGTPAQATDFQTAIRPFFEAHCFKCHGAEKQKGDLRLDTLDADFTRSRTASTWIEVRDNLNLGEMPPEDEPRPDTEKVIGVSQWIAGELRAMQARTNSTGGRALMRRLSRSEYLNTVRDLLKVQFVEGDGPREILPPDGTLEGFDKVSKALLLDPSLMENYIAAARSVADRAVRVRPPRVKTLTQRYEFETIPETMGIGYIAARRSSEFSDDGIILYQEDARTAGFPRHPYNDQQIPVLGRYTLRVRAGAKRGPDGEPVYMEMARRTQKKRFRVDAPIDDPQIYEWTVTVDPVESGEWGVRIVSGSRFADSNMDSINLRMTADELSKKGENREAIRLRTQGRAEGIFTTFQQSKPGADGYDKSILPRLFLDYFEIEGPLQEEFPPASTRNLYPEGHDNPATKTIENARAIFAQLLPRAFRRPVTEEEVDAQLKIVTGELDRGHSFHSAMKVGLTAMLCSPDFLHLIEPGEGDSRRELNDYEIATRLSYFLWSSMPDDELFELAAAGKLKNSATLDAQVTRMLADPKAEALVTDFATQWLKIAEFDQFKPDAGLYGETYYQPQFAGIGADMEEEARAFFRDVLTKNKSVLNFLNSDWIMVNEKLAAFYGIDGVTGEQFRRVALPAGSPRGGIIGMAGFHKWGADGNRTKPVERGKYILAVLFNDPPDPPPPNAGEVEPNISGERLTVRERLLRHQEVEACAGCHRAIDPYGLGMENFNAVGLWRDFQDGEDRYIWRDNEKPIITEGSIPNGKSYADFEEFRTLLVDQSDRFRRGLAEKLFIYALGRTIEPTDEMTLENLVTELRENGDTFSALIRAIVRSESFRTK